MTTTMRMPYGAYELKRCYQKNMLIGLATVVLATTALIGGMSIYLALHPAVAVGTGGDGDGGGDILIDLGKRIIIIPVPPDIQIGPRPKPPKAPGGKLVLVPTDSMSDGEDDMPNFTDTPYGRGPESGNDSGGGNGGDPGWGGYGLATPAIPHPDSFYAVEEIPVLISEVNPDYPTLARSAGFTGTVTIQAYVDEIGRVKVAKAVRCTRPGIGFEEEAVRAAYKSVYRPGIQNGHPVGVWVAYKVRFVMDP